MGKSTEMEQQTTLHGATIERDHANRAGGPMHWPAAQFRTIGPLVFIRELKETGDAGKWELMALALDPARYVTATAGEFDYTRNGNGVSKRIVF